MQYGCIKSINEWMNKKKRTMVHKIERVCVREREIERLFPMQPIAEELKKYWIGVRIREQ